MIATSGKKRRHHLHRPARGGEAARGALLRPRGPGPHQAPDGPVGLRAARRPRGAARAAEQPLSERIYMSSPDVGQAEEQALVRAIRSGWVAPLGPEVDAFEAELAAYGAGARHARRLSSGTAALHLGAAIAWACEPGDRRAHLDDDLRGDRQRDRLHAARRRSSSTATRPATSTPSCSAEAFGDVARHRAPTWARSCRWTSIGKVADHEKIGCRRHGARRTGALGRRRVPRCGPRRRPAAAYGTVAAVRSTATRS